jgi:hypothetical protein
MENLQQLLLLMLGDGCDFVAVPALVNSEIEYGSNRKNLNSLLFESTLVKICIRTQGEFCFPQIDAWISFG